MRKYDAIIADFNKLREIVVSYYDIDDDELLKCNKENVVEARYCLISIMCDKYNDFDISKICGLSKSLVNKIRNRVNSNQMHKCFYIDLKNIKKSYYELNTNLLRISLK